MYIISGIIFKRVGRDGNVFPYIILDYSNGVIDEIDDSKGVIGYTLEEITEEITGHRYFY